MSPGVICYLLAVLSCFVVSAQAQQWDWIRRFSGESTALKLASDADENVYVAGTFSGTNYLGTNEFSVAETNGSFLLKLNPEGEVEWAHSLHGSVQQLVVTSNGVLFLTGRFIPKDRPDYVRPEPVLIARVDNGTFTWMDVANESAGGGLSFAPDGNIWVVGVSNKVFFRKYSQQGATLASFDMGEQYFQPTGLAVNRNEEIFVSGIRYGYHYLIGGVTTDGTSTWSWSPPPGNFHQALPINGIAATKEGNVVAVGNTEFGFGLAAFINIFSPLGEAVSHVVRSGPDIGTRKSLYNGNGLAMDVHDNVHVVGLGVTHYLGPSPSDGLWFASFSNGVKLSESQISNTRYSYPWNVGHAISVTPDDTVYIAGNLTGYAIFGSNVSVGASSGFIARRSTLMPELKVEKALSGTTLSWPRSAFPFALQQSDTNGTNWSFVTQAPERIGTHWRTILPPDDGTITYRLLRTNEVPIYYPLSVGWTQKPGVAFLDHTSAVILASSGSGFVQSFSASVHAAGPTHVSFDVLNALNGEQLVRRREMDIQLYRSPSANAYLCYCDGVSTDAVTFSPGQHDLLLKISDGASVYTNALSFEVLTFDDALAELNEQLAPLESARKGRRAVAFYRKSLDAEHPKRAGQRWKQFVKALAHLPGLSEENRGRLQGAADRMRGLLLAQ